MNKLGVAVMCKDESHIIEKCLASIVDIADEVIMTDTGSSDPTIILAGLFLQSHNIKFKIYNEPFVDFAHNRNLLLQRAAHSDVHYVLMLDCDEQLVLDGMKPSAFKEGLSYEGYNMRMLSGNTSYYLPRLTSNLLQWKYIGVTHEFLETSGRVLGTFKSPYINQTNNGSRRADNRKFTQDIELLTKAIATAPSHTLKARYTFYLAQTYYAIGVFKEAIECYEKRTHMGGWKDEIFYSFYQLGNIYAQTTTSLDKTFRNYMLAYNTCPRAGGTISGA
jgi:glycosyltransferase involved in cell wall biosynthesis